MGKISRFWGFCPPACPNLLREHQRSPPHPLSLDPDFKNNMILQFSAPANLKCEVQTSTTLRPEDWVTIHTVFGTGQNTQFRHPFNPRESPKRFYRLLYQAR